MSLRHSGLAILLGMALAACSLAGDITPPPGARPFRPLSATPIPATIAANPPATPDAGNLPVSLEPGFRPSAAAGAPIYAEKCANCHGPTGQGDGVRAAQIPADIPVPKFADPGLGREATPQEWFDVVTKGRLERFMPPFNQSLSEADRWNVVAYLITLAAPPEQIEKGRAVYEANCAACHGPAGRGDGPQAQGTLTDLSAPAYFASRAPIDLSAAIDVGSPIPEHAFGRVLTEADRQAVVDYVRTLAYDYAAPDTELVAEAPAQTRSLAGVIRNGTAGAATPSDLSVNLIGLDPGLGVMTTLTGTADATGAFLFRDVPVTEGRQFVVATDYEGVTYYSPVPNLSSGETQLTVYERTGDAGALRIERVHTFVLFETPGEVTVGQLVLINNLGDKTFAPDDGRTVTIMLPPGSYALNVRDGEEGVTFFRTESGFAHTAPVIPGRETLDLFYSFKLPWDGSLDFSQSLPYPVDNVNVLVSDMSVALSGPQFVRIAAQDVQGRPFQNYARAGLAASEPLTFRLSSGPMASVATAIGNFLGSADTSGLALGASVLGVTLLVLGAWWWRQQAGGGRPTVDRRQAARIQATRIQATRSRDELLDAIAELDDDYAAGKVPQAEYERERAWLKDELKKTWR